MKNGVLYVHTATSAWAAELDPLREALLDSVQRHAPHAGVRDLRFRVGPLPPLPRRDQREPRPEPAEPTALVELPESLARALARVPDDALRDVIGAAATVSLARQR